MSFAFRRSTAAPQLSGPMRSMRARHFPTSRILSVSMFFGGFGHGMRRLLVAGSFRCPKANVLFATCFGVATKVGGGIIDATLARDWNGGFGGAKNLAHGTVGGGNRVKRNCMALL